MRSIVSSVLQWAAAALALFIAPYYSIRTWASVVDPDIWWHIRTGQLIKPDDLRWQPWPQGNLPASYIVEGKRPIGDFVGAVARSQFHVGEPIVESDIVMPGSRGFLAAVLKPGLRAVLRLPAQPARPALRLAG